MGEPTWRLGAQLRLILLTYSSLSGPEDMALGVGCHSAFSATWGKTTAHCSGARLAVTGGVMELTCELMSVGFLDLPLVTRAQVCKGSFLSAGT